MHLEAPAELLADNPVYKVCLEFAQLTIRQRELKEELNTIESRKRAMDPLIKGFFGEAGFGMLQVAGFTMSLRRDPWVYPIHGVNRQSVCEALKLSGLGRLVKENFNTKLLTSYIRELEEHHQLVAGADPDALQKILPPALAHVLEVRPGFVLQVLDRRKPRTPETEETETYDDA
jgi:hypothetical protein